MPNCITLHRFHTETNSQEYVDWIPGGRMFKRLSKSRRHSADDVALSLSSPTTLDEPPGTSTPRDNCQSISPAALLRVSRTKYTRRSCGDASAMQALLATKQEQEQDVAEADYQMVTAVPAFIVEHEPEKQRGKYFRTIIKRTKLG